MKSRGWARALTPQRRPVSHPRSSNRTCPIKASGFPTGFTAKPTNESSIGHLEAAGLRVAKHHFFAELAGAARWHRITRSSPCDTACSEVPGSYSVLSDSSSITAPSLLHKHTRSKGPFLRRHYQASSVVWPSPTPRLAAALSGDVRGRNPQPIPSLPH